MPPAELQGTQALELLEHIVVDEVQKKLNFFLDKLCSKFLLLLPRTLVPVTFPDRRCCESQYRSSNYIFGEWQIPPSRAVYTY